MRFSGGEIIDAEEKILTALYAESGLADQLRAYIRSANSAIAALDTLRRKATTELDIVLLDKARSRQLAEDIDVQYAVLRRAGESIFQVASAGAPAWLRDLVDRSEDDGSGNYMGIYTEPVSCIYDQHEQAIMIRLPMLGRMPQLDVIAASNNRLLRLHSHIYAHVLSEIFRQSIVAQGTDLTKFAHKFISVLYVYPTTDQRSMLDTDSHDTKAVIDEICRYFPTGDSALDTSVLMQTILSSDLPKSTYISITPAYLGPLSISQIVSFWEKKNAQESFGQNADS